LERLRVILVKLQISPLRHLSRFIEGGVAVYLRLQLLQLLQLLWSCIWAKLLRQLHQLPVGRVSSQSSL